MPFAELLSRLAAELALFAGVGFLLFAINDVIVDLIYFGRAIWRAIVVRPRYPRLFAEQIETPADCGAIAVFIPAWEESSVIAPMLRATLERFDHPDYRLFVGIYRNDPATAAAVASVVDPRIEAVEIPVDGPTTKADCLNHLYGIM